MSPSRVPDHLDHMLEAAVQACAYVEGVSKEEFLQDKRTQQAVIFNLIADWRRGHQVAQGRRGICRSASAGALAQHERHAQPHLRTAILRSTWRLSGKPSRRRFPA